MTLYRKVLKHKTTSHTRDPESQEVSPFPAGDHKATRNRHGSITDKHDTQMTKRIHKRCTASERFERLDCSPELVGHL